jgi:hypothetical protein
MISFLSITVLIKECILFEIDIRLLSLRYHSQFQELSKMSSQRGNVQKSRAPKYQNKSAFKNVYHDTSKKTQQIVSTVVSGVCSRCKDCIDWKIKYKKYKPLTQPKTWYS